MFFTTLGFAHSNPISGTIWISHDDNTGKPRAEIKMNVSNGELTGQVYHVYPKPGDKGICANCPGEFKDKPTKNLTVIWGLNKHGKNSWEGGHILDPSNGKIYRAKLLFNGNKLYVRGYIGVSVLGRTQVWTKKEAH